MRGQEEAKGERQEEDVELRGEAEDEIPSSSGLSSDATADQRVAYLQQRLDASLAQVRSL